MKYSSQRHPYAIHVPGRYWLIQFLAYVVFVVTMLRCVPMEIAREPWAQTYTEFMASIVPMLGQIEKIPGFHPFLRFYYAVLWGLIPMPAILMMLAGMRTPQSTSTRSMRLNDPVRPLLLRIGLTTFALLLLLSWPISLNTPSWRDMGLVQSVLGVGWFGLMVLWAMNLWLGHVFILIERIYFSLINKRK